MRAQIAYVVLAAPATRADFEFKIISWFNISGKDALDTEAELDRMLEEATPTLFLYGRRDFSRARPSAEGGETIILDGGHDLGADYEKIAGVILDRSSQTSV